MQVERCHCQRVTVRNMRQGSPRCVWSSRTRSGAVHRAMVSSIGQVDQEKASSSEAQMSLTGCKAMGKRMPCFAARSKQQVWAVGFDGGSPGDTFKVDVMATGHSCCCANLPLKGV